MPPNGIKLSKRHLSWLYAGFAVLFISGAAWIFFHHPWLLKIHGGAAMLSLVLFGTLIPLHIKRGWAAKRNQLNGLMFIVFNLALIFTGYALYYFSGEKSRWFSSGIHMVLGICFPFFLIWHIAEGRKSRKRRPSIK